MTGHFICNRKNIRLLYTSLRVSKFPCPLAITKSASVNAFRNSSEQSGSTVPGASDPLGMAFTRSVNPLSRASSMVASLMAGAPRTAAVTFCRGRSVLNRAAYQRARLHRRFYFFPFSSSARRLLISSSDSLRYFACSLSAADSSCGATGAA